MNEFIEITEYLPCCIDEKIIKSKRCIPIRNIISIVPERYLDTRKHLFKCYVKDIYQFIHIDKKDYNRIKKIEAIIPKIIKLKNNQLERARNKQL